MLALVVTQHRTYAHVERELRFRLPRLPDLPGGCRELRIDDRYLLGTRLRLRRVEEAGQVARLKLGQKVRPDHGSPHAVAHTTMYLSPAEFDVLAALPAHALRKTRHLVPVGDGRHLAVDVFDGHLAGMVTAEVDLGEHASSAAGLLGRDDVRGLLAGGLEVTEDEDHTGGALAARPSPPPWPAPARDACR